MPKSSSTRPDAERFGGRSTERWNALNRGGNPFTDHRFLQALRDAGCVGPGTGWEDVTTLLGEDHSVAPAWIKTHSHGEFVFDFAWAQAAHGAGLRWYPKLLVAVPLTPVTGPRLLAEDHASRVEQAGRLVEFVKSHELSSCGVNFCDAADDQALEEAGWLARSDWQYHWFNRGYADFDAFLAELRSKPRKNIRRERRLAYEDGWTYRWIDGDAITPEELDTIHDCYLTTFLLYGNRPSLNRSFFEQAARAFGDRFLVCMASRDGKDLACSVFWRDDARLYGRYWGATVETRDVHFEACYYQGIDYCIKHGLQAFEPGAQGEHKIRRGFVPVRTRSRHYVRHRALREGIRRWLEMERQALDEYRVALRDLEPYREPDPTQ